MNWAVILGVVLILINITAYVVCGMDKSFAVHQRRRIPEKTLMWIVILGGSLGFWIGMQIYRHKTKHPKFYIGVPLILIAQLFAAWYILK